MYKVHSIKGDSDMAWQESSWSSNVVLLQDIWIDMRPLCYLDQALTLALSPCVGTWNPSTYIVQDYSAVSNFIDEQSHRAWTKQGLWWVIIIGET